MTEGDFKTRLANHKQSFRNETHKNSTALSQHIWEIKENPEPDIKWEILSKAKPRIAASPYCFLCVEEKWHILKNNNNPNCLNKRSELTHRSVVFHRSRHKLNKSTKYICMVWEKPCVHRSVTDAAVSDCVKYDIGRTGTGMQHTTPPRHSNQLISRLKTVVKTTRNKLLRRLVLNPQ